MKRSEWVPFSREATERWRRISLDIRRFPDQRFMAHPPTKPNLPRARRHRRRP